MAKANINFSNKAGSQAQVMRLVIRIASKTKKNCDKNCLKSSFH